MEAIINSIYNNPEDWKSTNHAFRHKSGFAIWTANGFFHIKPYGNSVAMTFLQKIRLWRAFKWWSKNAPIEAISPRGEL